MRFRFMEVMEINRRCLLIPILAFVKVVRAGVSLAEKKFEAEQVEKDKFVEESVSITAAAVPVGLWSAHCSVPWVNKEVQHY